METSFGRILVPVDGSPQSIVAFRVACFIGKQFNSQLTAVHIDESSMTEETLRQMLGKENSGIDFHLIHRKGSVHKEILAAATETDSSLIVMGTHGVSGFQEFWMGSNAYKVVNSANCPVLTMRDDAKTNSFTKIVLPIDTSFETRQKVPYAIRLAQKFGSEIHVLGVSVDNDKDAEVKISSYIRQTIDVIEQHKIKAVSHRNMGGNITDKTIAYAKEIHANLIVAMSEQEPQIGSFFLGKYAQQLVNHSGIPVLTIPPREDIMVTEARL